MTEDEADFVIVGAGSAGAVLANRLSADGRHRVILLEAGPPDSAISLRVPAAMASNLMSRRHNWAFQGEPEPGLGGRQLVHDRGKTLGGSSSINGMVFIRGHARDFDGWRQKGCTGWSHAEVLPYFRRMETYSGGVDDWRGGDGPMRVDRARPQSTLARAFLAAGAQAGYPATRDVSGHQQEGFGVFDRSVHRGIRWSTARAYLDPARARPNLRIVTNVQAERVLFDGRRAVGIEARDAAGTRRFAARKEVILSAGAVGTPHLLLLSGVGPGRALSDLGIAVLADRPGVGQNLKDHPDIVMKFRCNGPHSIWPQTRTLGRFRAGATWLLRRKGAAATNHFDTVANVRSGPGVDYPDLQFTLAPVAMDETGLKVLPFHAYQVHIGLMRAYSKGAVTLRSVDPRDPPRILCNYYADPRDRDRMRTGIGLLREIVRQPALAALTEAEFQPGPQMADAATLDRFLSDHTASQWHLSCTARMGSPQDAMAVVDPSGRVIGVEGLRVADASVMPDDPNCNTNATTIMIGEKLSDAILGRDPLPPIERPVWTNPQWETVQR